MRGPKSLLLGKFTILSLLFLPPRGAKLHCQLRWGAMAGFAPPGSATDYKQNSCIWSWSLVTVPCACSSAGQQLAFCSMNRGKWLSLIAWTDEAGRIILLLLMLVPLLVISWPSCEERDPSRLTPKRTIHYTCGSLCLCPDQSPLHRCQ